MTAFQRFFGALLLPFRFLYFRFWCLVLGWRFWNSMRCRTKYDNDEEVDAWKCAFEIPENQLLYADRKEDPQFFGLFDFEVDFTFSQFGFLRRFLTVCAIKFFEKSGFFVLQFVMDEGKIASMLVLRSAFRDFWNKGNMTKHLKNPFSWEAFVEFCEFEKAKVRTREEQKMLSNDKARGASE